MCEMKSINLCAPHDKCGSKGKNMLTDDEKRDRLTEYKKKLELGLSAVNEHLAELN